MGGNAIVARARALVGVRFRPQGRSPAQGLDCIGLAALASEVPTDRLRRDYGLRSSDPNEINKEFDAFGFLRIAPDEAEAGDLLLVRAGPAQLHIVILTPLGFVHADAGLRRVVETPGAVPWPVAATWRHPDHKAGVPPSPSRHLH